MITGKTHRMALRNIETDNGGVFNGEPEGNGSHSHTAGDINQAR